MAGFYQYRGQFYVGTFNTMPEKAAQIETPVKEVLEIKRSCYIVQDSNRRKFYLKDKIRITTTTDALRYDRRTLQKNPKIKIPSMIWQARSLFNQKFKVSRLDI